MSQRHKSFLFQPFQLFRSGCYLMFHCLLQNPLLLLNVNLFIFLFINLVWQVYLPSSFPLRLFMRWYSPDTLSLFVSSKLCAYLKEIPLTQTFLCSLLTFQWPFELSGMFLLSILFTLCVVKVRELNLLFLHSVLFSLKTDGWKGGWGRVLTLFIKQLQAIWIGGWQRFYMYMKLRYTFL